MDIWTIKQKHAHKVGIKKNKKQKKKHCHIMIFYVISNQIKIWKQFKTHQ